MTENLEAFEKGPEDAWYAIVDLLEELNPPGWERIDVAPIDFVKDALREHFAQPSRPEEAA